MTKQQKAVLGFIIAQTEANHFPPTMREIMEAFRFNSPNSANGHLTALEKKGFILRKPGSARAIKVLLNVDGTPRGSHAITA